MPLDRITMFFGMNLDADAARMPQPHLGLLVRLALERVDDDPLQQPPGPWHDAGRFRIAGGGVGFEPRHQSLVGRDNRPLRIGLPCARDDRGRGSAHELVFQWRLFPFVGSVVGMHIDGAHRRTGLSGVSHIDSTFTPQSCSTHCLSHG